MNTRSSTMLIDHTQGLKFTESPRWHDGKLWFLDIHDQRIKTAGLDGRLDTALELPFKPNGFGFRRDGSILVGDALQRQIHRWDGTALQPVADLGDITCFCLSDGIVDAQDRIYVGDIGYNFWDPALSPVDTCVIACVEPDGRARVVADGLRFPNGMVITPDGRTLIVAECTGYCLTAFDIRADGSLANRRVFAELPEGAQPDGIALDAEGAVWLANPAGPHAVLRVREGGEILERIELDTHAYAVMLGGPQRRHLFISASDSHDPAQIAQAASATLRVVEVDVPGAGIP
ncbi:MAG: SMP-30/gluconolactonase/LRE family protein [Gammaproteobacteria bacterium]|nr:SMP-30/gluconolactonase/LRE family protein [Gammaproteobacteria bacterium]MBK9468534.1 SMP-30/gluconolactonase/LRE family protein [Gammaproteobacteria bacterium]MBP6479243.1 SMP-30/gluconolactonase/LRE family protein [Pseudomonadales bacterium]MBP7909243.1 SMP-30/gluconolactonase/LRE family protein [Pseudomonadales bacterium]